MAGEVELDGVFEVDESLAGTFDKDESLDGVADGSDTLIGDRCKKLDFRMVCSVIYGGV